jgi:SAM-dependent methyltransferase
LWYARAVPNRVSFLITYSAKTAPAAASLASALASEGQVVVAGDGVIALAPGITHVLAGEGRGRALRAALPALTGAVVVLHEPEPRADSYAALVDPIEGDQADAVYAQGRARSPLEALAAKAMTRLAEVVAETPLSDPAPTVRAFRTTALRTLELREDGPEIDAEILVKLAARAFRVATAPLEVSRTAAPWTDRLRRAAALLRYATVQNAQDNLHEGYNTLARMDGAPNYNAWIGKRFEPFLGQRVLEVGAGIGTITRELERGREQVIALEMDPFYVDRLKNLFRDKPHVRPVHSEVATTDWAALGREGIDTVVLSNVLEHIEDDGEAIRNFRAVLPEGGRLLILVPALPALFGAMDEAVGHFRRYTKDTLEQVICQNGFALERLEWMNLAGIPGWFLNGRVFRRRAVPPLQLRLYDQVAPLLAEAESRFPIPVGLSLFAVARAGAQA